jgi:hypothetical protein
MYVTVWPAVITIVEGLITGIAGDVQLTVTLAPHITSVLEGSEIPIVNIAPEYMLLVKLVFTGMLQPVVEIVTKPIEILSAYKLTTVLATAVVTVPDTEVAPSLTGPVIVPHLAITVAGADDTVLEKLLLPQTVPIDFALYEVDAVTVGEVSVQLPPGCTVVVPIIALVKEL